MNYWERRCGYKYYSETLLLCRRYGGCATSVLEVGPKDTLFLEELKWIPHKTAVDRALVPRIAEAENIQADFLHWEIPRKYDLAICLQVLEHLEEVIPFARKLMASAPRVIVSVPLNWPPGFCKGHRQDPVDLSKLTGWMGKAPLDYSIANDNMQRLIAVFDSV